MRTRTSHLALLAVVPFLYVSTCWAGPTYISPEEAAQADEDFAYQGEYEGVNKIGDMESVLAMQIIARGNGAFVAKMFQGGLPGEEGSQPGPTVELNREGNTLKGTDPSGAEATFTLEGETLTFSLPTGESLTLTKQHRESPTLGAEPPEGAVVLFDGTNLDHWQEGARMSDDGLLLEGCTSTDTFQSHVLHLEFLLPYMPEDQGQLRSNSGCYPQGRYEIQILDSFGLEGLNNECGGIYALKDPDVNMCFPPLTWQTYDVELHAGQYDENGELVAHPRMTVKHNGVVIHDDVELPAATPEPLQPAGPGPGPVYLQSHLNPMMFRNVWVLPLED